MRFAVTIELQINGDTLQEVVGIIEHRLKRPPGLLDPDPAGVALASVSAKGVTPSKPAHG